MQINLPFLNKIRIGKIQNSVETDASWERFKALLYGADPNGKTPVTTNTAIQVAAVIRCVDVVAKDMAALPLHLYRRVPQKGSEKAADEPLYTMLHSMPNPETTAFDFWYMYIYNLMLTPFACAYVDRDRNGFPLALYNLPTRYCQMKRNDVSGERYVVFNDGKIIKTIYPENLMYTLGARLSDVDNPMDPISLASKVLGLSNALNDFAQSYFDNGTNAGGVVNIKDQKKEEVFREFVRAFLESYKSVQNANKTMFLNGDATFTPVKNNPNESQALESRQNQVIEICRMFGVSPIKAFEYGRATYSNMEQVNIEYVTGALNPMAVRIEQSIMRDLIPSYQRRTLYAKWNFYGLLKGDTAAQTAWFQMNRQGGIMSANEIRELMDMNGYPEEEGGNAYLVNGNMISVATAAKQPPRTSGSAQSK